MMARKQNLTSYTLKNKQGSLVENSLLLIENTLLLIENTLLLIENTVVFEENQMAIVIKCKKNYM